MKFLFIILVAALICPNYGLIPSEEIYRDLHFRQSREDKESIGGNTRNLVEKLVNDMTNVAKNATNSLREFGTGLQKEVENFRSGVEGFLSEQQCKIRNAVQGAYNTGGNITSGVRHCIEINLNKSRLVFSNVLTKTMECADNHVKEFGALIERQNELANNAIEYALTAQEELNKCTEDNHGNFFTTNACLASVSIRAEIKVAGYIAQNALGLARLNLALVTLPGVLEICGAARLIEASIATGGYVVDIGRCSVASIFTNVFGSSGSEPNEDQPEPVNVDLQSTDNNQTSIESVFTIQPETTPEYSKLLKPLYSTHFRDQEKLF